jgi:hypothetical protein
MRPAPSLVSFLACFSPVMLAYVAQAGKVPDGITELPFEFPLSALPGQTLYDSYHGVYVNISYASFLEAYCRC